MVELGKNGEEWGKMGKEWGKCYGVGQVNAQEGLGALA